MRAVGEVSALPASGTLERAAAAVIAVFWKVEGSEGSDRDAEAGLQLDNLG